MTRRITREGHAFGGVRYVIEKRYAVSGMRYVIRERHAFGGVRHVIGERPAFSRMRHVIRKRHTVRGGVRSRRLTAGRAVEVACLACGSCGRGRGAFCRCRSARFFWRGLHARAGGCVGFASARCRPLAGTAAGSTCPLRLPVAAAGHHGGGHLAGTGTRVMGHVSAGSAPCRAVRMRSAAPCVTAMSGRALLRSVCTGGVASGSSTRSSACSAWLPGLACDGVT